MSTRRILLSFCAVVAIGLAGFLAWAWRPTIPAIEPPTASSLDPALIRKGAEFAAIGNCALCHTKPGGRPFAGGLPISTPFGTIYSTNITPDPESGIGKWSQTAFLRAMREGVDRGGHHLYPAFPYDHFTKVTDADVDAIYAFLMTRNPVRAEILPNKLPFPLNFRLVIAGWKLLFFRSGEFRPNALQNEVWNRGAYLMEGLGHCGSCHTPRNLLGAERQRKAVAGGEAEGWDAPALNLASPAPVPWTEDAVFDYLRHGWDRLHGVAAGPMMPVVHDLASAPEEDLRAMGIYIASLAEEPEEERQKKTERAIAFAKSRAWGAVPEHPDKANGEGIFAGACASCHHAGGVTPSTKPVELALSTMVNLPDPRNLIRIILDGIMPEEGERGPIMPGFADALTDQQVVVLAGYVRAHFTDLPAWPDLATRVSQIREEEQKR
jgi:mono/diheme cytochrome c family protein